MTWVKTARAERCVEHPGGPKKPADSDDLCIEGDRGSIPCELRRRRTGRRKLLRRRLPALLGLGTRGPSRSRRRAVSTCQSRHAARTLCPPPLLRQEVRLLLLPLLHPAEARGRRPLSRSPRPRVPPLRRAARRPAIARSPSSTSGEARPPPSRRSRWTPWGADCAAH